jgi:hypothetical protein
MLLIEFHTILDLNITLNCFKNTVHNNINTVEQVIEAAALSPESCPAFETLRAAPYIL